MPPKVKMPPMPDVTHDDAPSGMKPPPKGTVIKMGGGPKRKGFFKPPVNFQAAAQRKLAAMNQPQTGGKKKALGKEESPCPL
jgi:hypothetical protein